MKTDGPILFISHKKQQCGVYQFGLGVSKALEASRRFSFRYVECNDVESFVTAVEDARPAAIIYNHHPATMPWLSRDLIRRFKLVHLGVMHETTQALADGANSDLFDYHIAPDPTLLLRNPIVFKTGRLVPRYQGRQQGPEPPAPVVGSFGFGTQGKGFQRLILKVQEDFDHATIRLRIPFSAFFDADGAKARAIGEECRGLIVKPGIELELHHDFLSQDDLMDFLAGNSINAFLYEDQTGRGISSVIDFALAVGRPLAVTRSSMFRHVNRSRPSIAVEDSSLSDILARGSFPTARYMQEWTAENLVWDYERIVAAVLSRTGDVRRAGGFNVRSLLHARGRREGREWVGRASRALLRRVAPALRSTRQRLTSSPLHVVVDAVQDQPLLRAGLGAVRAFLATTSIGPVSPTAEPGFSEAQPVRETVRYQPDALIRERFNRILGASAQRDYQPAMEYLLSHAASPAARKRYAVDIEQAFILDAVSRLTRQVSQPSLLGIGCHGQPASMALAMAGHHLEEIDPVTNYDLVTYMTKPTRKRSFFDLVFAVSVGRTRADAAFFRNVEELLAPGGVGVLTCAIDVGHDVRPPDPSAFSVQSLDSLLSLMDRCELVDQPDWRLEGDSRSPTSYQRAVASLVFRKVRV